MNKENVCRAIGECHELIYNGNKHNNKSMITSGAFGLEIIGIMLSEPVEVLPEIHVIKIDVVEQENTENTGNPETGNSRPQPYLCPRCKNEEFSPGGKFCKICGLPIVDLCRG